MAINFTGNLIIPNEKDIEKKVKTLFNKANNVFNRNMEWVGVKNNEIQFNVTSRGAKNIIDMGIGAANIPYYLKCFVDKKTTLFG